MTDSTTTQSDATNPDGHAHGPGGLYSDEDHHQLQEGESAHVDDDGSVHRVSGGEKKKLPESTEPPSKPSSPGPGWVSFASWKPTSDITKLSGSWAVPEAPTGKGLEIVFLHLGLEGKSGDKKIFAPIVLQWGKTPYGGGLYWSLACWLQAGEKIIVGNYIKVATGDTIEGEIVHTEDGDQRRLSMKGRCGDQLASLDFSLSSPLVDELAYGGVLEAYAVNMKCSQYPACADIIFSDLQVESGVERLVPSWKSTNEVQDCGQATNVLSPNQVRINFRGAAG